MMFIVSTTISSSEPIPIPTNTSGGDWSPSEKEEGRKQREIL